MEKTDTRLLEQLEQLEKKAEVAAIKAAPIYEAAIKEVIKVAEEASKEGLGNIVAADVLAFINLKISNKKYQTTSQYISVTKSGK